MDRETIDIQNKFKDTPLGPLPEEWEVVRLKEVGISFFSGGTPSTKIPEYWNGSIPWTTSAHIDNIYLTQGAKRITPEGLENSSSNMVPRNNLVIGTRVGVGKVAINLIDVAISQDLTGVIVDKEKGILEFLAYALMTDGIQTLFHLRTRGTTIKGISREDLEYISIPLPPLPEQRAIAHVLSTIQHAIEQQDKIIRSARELKKSLMHKLFTDGLADAELKETEIGRMPAHWGVVRLGELGKLQYGYTASAIEEDTGMKFLRITDIKDGGQVDWENVPYCEIYQGDYGKYNLTIGDILFARIGATTGKTTYIDREINGVFASYLIRFKPSAKDINAEFLYYYTQSDQYWAQVYRNREGQLKKGLNARALASLIFLLPFPSEQQEIAYVLRTVDRKIKIEEKRKSTLQKLFKTILHLLMSGQVRVKDIDLNMEANTDG